MYYCNKCGHMGNDGPGHCRPVPVGGTLKGCGYDAVKCPPDEQLPLIQVANVLAQFLPDGFKLRLCIERGAAWVELENAHGYAVVLPDAGDRNLIRQLNDALVASQQWPA